MDVWKLVCVDEAYREVEVGGLLVMYNIISSGFALTYKEG